jgi:hypothetical protein
MDNNEILKKFEKAMPFASREQILQTIQALELEKHTKILDEARDITKENAE